MKRKQSSHDSEGARRQKRQRSSRKFESLSEELILQCLAGLKPRDLLKAGETSRHMNRLSNDDQLWKLLYNVDFLGGRKRMGPLKAPSKSLSKPLHNGKTWKELFRVAYNWTTGNARTSQLSLRSSVLPRIPKSMHLNGDDLTASNENTEAEDWEEEEEGKETRTATSDGYATTPARPPHIAWHGRCYFVGKRTISSQTPSVSVYSASAATNSPCITQITSPGLQACASLVPQGIAEMRMDDLPYSEHTGIRLAVFYTSGQYSIFRLRNLRTAISAKFSYTEEFFSSQYLSKPIVMARFHSPLLVTASSNCSIRFRLLEERKAADGTEELHISLSQPTMRTHMCFAPMVMRLEPSGTPVAGKALQDFRVSLAYSTPYYPAAFTVGVQVFDIHVPSRSESSTFAGKNRPRRLEVLARSAIAVPPVMAPLTPRSPSSHSLEAASLMPAEAVVTSIEQDGPYIVTSKSDNTISVYRVLDPGRSSYTQVCNRLRLLEETGTSVSIVEGSSASPAKMQALPLKIRHVRTLFGHTAGVDAVNIADGRCVSTGRDGVKVWELPRPDEGDAESIHDGEDEDEGFWQPSVEVRDGTDREHNGRARCTWLGLDASKIVTVCSGDSGEVDSVKVYDFA